MVQDDSDDGEGFNGLGGVHFRNSSGMPVRLRGGELREANERLSTKPSEDFISNEDWERLERIKGLAELLDMVLFWCWDARTAGAKSIHYGAAQKRFVAMSALIKPELFDGKSYEEIGLKIGTTKQNFSYMARDFQREFGLKFQRSHKADNLHSEAATKSWKERKK